MRKCIATLVLAGVLVTGTLAPSTLAQEATPEGVFADLGLPELNVSVSATTIDGIPQSLEAGRYLLNLTVADDLEFGGGVEFVQPVGIPVDEFVAGMAPPDAGAASPVADAGMATPASGNGEDAGVPAFLFESIYAGGISAPAGTAVQGVIDLGPGQWVAHGGFESIQTPVVVDVTGEMPADLPEPASGATLTMGEYVIKVTAGELVAGTQVVKIENIGAQPHFIVAGYTEVDVTEEDIAAVLEADMTGTPAAVDFDPDADFHDAFFTGVQSTGTTMWVTVSLEPATYVLLCFFPDLGDGLPHANHGMLEIVEVGA